MAKLAVRRLPGALGCEIENLDLRFLDDDHFFTIENALHEHLLVILSRQTIGPRSLMGLARRFGDPMPDAGARHRHGMEMDLQIVSGRNAANGTPEGDRDATAYFRSDGILAKVPARCTIFSTQSGSATDPEAVFADQRRAYQDLSEDKRAGLDGLVALHRAGDRNALGGQVSGEAAVVHHPIVRTHPHTRKASLYGVAGTSFAIQGMGDNEGRALLDDLAGHATQERYVTRTRFKPGDVVLWDNAALATAGPLAPEGSDRCLWRVRIAEERPTS
ncbi:MAG: TauD/TfdA family dioxygenase [Hyphomicrobiaceae bacterium]